MTTLPGQPNGIMPMRLCALIPLSPPLAAHTTQTASGTQSNVDRVRVKPSSFFNGIGRSSAAPGPLGTAPTTPVTAVEGSHTAKEGK
jgi:hypothetical protein